MIIVVVCIILPIVVARVANKIEEKNWPDKWKNQAIKDDILLERNPAVKNACDQINHTWDMYAYFNSEDFSKSYNNSKVLTNEEIVFRCEMFVLCLGELFVDRYGYFKSGNFNKIKNSIYSLRPHIVLDSLINMGLYIFSTKNSLRMLEYVMDKRDFPEGMYSASLIYFHETGQHYQNK